MKRNHKLTSEEKTLFIIATMANIPDDPNEKFGDVENQEINKDPIIGGADDVHRENPTNDLRDSDLVDAEPLQDIDQEESGLITTDENHEGKKTDMPSDSEEENLDMSNLEDSKDITPDEH